MNTTTKRSILRWTHLVLSVPIIGYVYSPFENIPQYASPTRYVFLPALALSGLWMWKGHLLTRLVAKNPAPIGTNAPRETTPPTTGSRYEKC